MSSKTSTEYHTHVRTQYKIQDTHIINHTPANIYMHREQNNTNTISGYYAAQDNTEHSGYYGHRPDTEQDTENSTHISPAQNNAQPQHRTTHLYAQLFTYIVLILLFNVHIKKLYNTAIYNTYTFWSPYWWGDQNNNNIDILKILYRKLLYHDIDKPYILLFN